MRSREGDPGVCGRPPACDGGILHGSGAGGLGGSGAVCVGDLGVWGVGTC